MIIDTLIEEYSALVKVCHQVDYSDKKAVKKNNDAVARMYAIVDTVLKEWGPDGVSRLTTLLDIEAYQTNLWIATHLLEKTTLDKPTENKALGIIERVAAGQGEMALGYRYWIEDWKSTRER